MFLPIRVKARKRRNRQMLLLVCACFLIATTLFLNWMVLVSLPTITISQHLLPSSEPPNFRNSFEGAPPCTPISDSYTSQRISFTLVTQSSMERLWIMRRQCQRWRGPISIAVMTGNSSAHDIRNRLEGMGCTNHPLSVQVMHLTNELQRSYPVNALRNLALANVQTSHFVYIDVDFWVSENLEEILRLPNIERALADDSKLALVLPAFQLQAEADCNSTCAGLAKNRMPRSIQDLQRLQNQTVRVWGETYFPAVLTFDGIYNPLGHNSTHYEKWFQQAAGSLETIHCFSSAVYEPYLALRYCRDMPPFQEVFTGYGKNKISWIWHLRRLGYVFQQVGHAFVVHYPHKKSASREEWMKMPQGLLWDDSLLKHKRPFELHISNKTELSNYLRVRVDETFAKFRNWLSRSPMHVDDVQIRTTRCPDWIEQPLRSSTPLSEDPW